MSLLEKGDTVAFIAPSSCVEEKDFELLELAKNLFENWGLKVVFASNLKEQYRYMAGSDEIRAKSVNEIFSHKDVRALFCVRGGAGALRILNLLDYDIIRKNPKVVVGLSDSTALQNAMFKMTQMSSLTGFLPLYDFKTGHISDEMSNRLKSVLFSDNHKACGGIAYKKGQAKGKLIGGCLSVFNYLSGTAYFPDLTDKILLLEDVGEKTYKIDLMLQQISLQPNFDKLRAIVFGQFSNMCKAQENDGDLSECVSDFAKKIDVPIVVDFPYGHIENRCILPLGKEVYLQALDSGCSISWSDN